MHEHIESTVIQVIIGHSNALSDVG